MPNLPREHSSAKTPILIVVTLPLSRNFYNGVLGHLCRAGFGPILLSAPDDKFRSPAHSLVPVTFFKFTLPTGRHDEKGGARAMKQLPQDLLVDDNPADVGLAREALAGGRHQAASAMYRMDLNLPRKDGREVLAETKADADLCTSRSWCSVPRARCWI
jgi:hypothetical protein